VSGHSNCAKIRCVLRLLAWLAKQCFSPRGLALVAQLFLGHPICNHADAAQPGSVVVSDRVQCFTLYAGVPTVAVYSDADRGARHVQMADQAVCIGPAAPIESYLSIPSVIDAARRTGAKAVCWQSL
jgi:hypothetical protein